MSVLRSVPWTSWLEWDNVRQLLYSEDVEDRRLGVKRVRFLVTKSFHLGFSRFFWLGAVSSRISLIFLFCKEISLGLHLTRSNLRISSPGSQKMFFAQASSSTREINLRRLWRDLIFPISQQYEEVEDCRFVNLFLSKHKLPPVGYSNSRS